MDQSREARTKKKAKAGVVGSASNASGYGSSGISRQRCQSWSEKRDQQESRKQGWKGDLASLPGNPVTRSRAYLGLIRELSGNELESIEAAGNLLSSAAKLGFSPKEQELFDPSLFAKLGIPLGGASAALGKDKHWIGARAAAMLCGPKDAAKAVWDSGWRPRPAEAVALLDCGIFSCEAPGQIGREISQALFAAIREGAGDAKAWQAARHALWLGDEAKGCAHAGSWIIQAGLSPLGLAQRMGSPADASKMARAALALGSERMEGAERSGLEAIGAQHPCAAGCPEERFNAWVAALAIGPAAGVRLGSLVRAGSSIELDWAFVPSDAVTRQTRGEVSNPYPGRPSQGSVMSHPAWAQLLNPWGNLGGSASVEESLAGQGIDAGSAGCAPAWPVGRALIQFDPSLAGAAEVARLCCALGAPEDSSPGSGELFDEGDPERRPCMAAVFAKARAAEGFEAMAEHAMRMGMLDAPWVDSAKDHGRCKAASFSEMAKDWDQGVAILEKMALLAVPTTDAPASVPRRLAL